MQSYNQQQQQLQQQQQQLISAQLRSQFMKPDPNTIKNVGNQLGALQVAHQQAAAAAASKAAQGSMNLRSHMGPAGHGAAVGMPQQAATPGPTYSPTPIQRPQGKDIS